MKAFIEWLWGFLCAIWEMVRTAAVLLDVFSRPGPWRWMWAQHKWEMEQEEMCSRYEADNEIRTVRRPVRDEIPGTIPPGIFPNREAPIILSEHGELVRRSMVYSLVPKIVIQSGVFQSKLPTHNAPADRLEKSPLWKSSLGRRCLIPAKAFYQSHRETKQWFRFSQKDAAGFFLLGLWRRWGIPAKLDADGCTEEPAKEVFGFTMITLDLKALGGMDANGIVYAVHDHMPVMLSADDIPAINDWLDVDPGNRFPGILLRPFPAGKMESKAVAR